MVRLNLLANRAATIMEASKKVEAKRKLPAWVFGAWALYMGALTYPIWR